MKSRPQLLAVGHSIAAGEHLRAPAANRTTAKLARMLGTMENNLGVSGSGFLTDGAGAYGKLAVGGNWLSVAAGAKVPTRAHAPYLSNLQVLDLITGINDIAQFGPVNAGFEAAWYQTILAAVAFARLGSWWPAAAGSIFTAAGHAYRSDSDTSYSGHYAVASAEGSTMAFTVPIDYDGQAIDFFMLGVQSQSAVSAHYATYTVTQGGTVLASDSNQAQTTGPQNAEYGMVLPFVLRVPTPDLSMIRGMTLVLTATGISNSALFNGVGFESDPAPVVILADCLRTPLGYTGLYGPGACDQPYIPTDADVDALNAQNARVAAQFSDGRVICDGADAIIDKTGKWINYVHPGKRTSKRIASIHENLILGSL